MSAVETFRDIFFSFSEHAFFHPYLTAVSFGLAGIISSSSPSNRHEDFHSLSIISLWQEHLAMTATPGRDKGKKRNLFPSFLALLDKISFPVFEFSFAIRVSTRWRRLNRFHVPLIFFHPSWLLWTASASSAVDRWKVWKKHHRRKKNVERKNGLFSFTAQLMWWLKQQHRRLSHEWLIAALLHHVADSQR